MSPRRAFFSIGLVCLGALAGFGMKTVLAEGIPSSRPLYYAGTLTEGGEPVNGTRPLVVQLWPDASASGTFLCRTGSNVPVVNGRFRLQLDDDCKTAIHANPGAYVEVIDGITSLGARPIGAVPYAVEAEHAVSATSAVNATNASNATTAAYADDAGHASTADTATNAAHASTADTATTAATATSLAAGPIAGGLTVYRVPGSNVTAPCAVNANSYVVDCTCPSGTFVASGGGGGSQGQHLRESWATDASSWRTTCTNGSADVMCSVYTLLCSRLGP